MKIYCATPPKIPEKHVHQPCRHTVEWYYVNAGGAHKAVPASKEETGVTADGS